MASIGDPDRLALKRCTIIPSMPDRIQQVVDSLLDEAVEAASRSNWAEVVRICGEVTNIDGDNTEAAQLLKAALGNEEHQATHERNAARSKAAKSFKETRTLIEQSEGTSSSSVPYTGIAAVLVSIVCFFVGSLGATSPAHVLAIVVSIALTVNALTDKELKRWGYAAIVILILSIIPACGSLLP